MSQNKNNKLKKTIHIMFTFDIKAIRNEYKNLSLIIKKGK